MTHIHYFIHMGYVSLSRNGNGQLMITTVSKHKFIICNCKMSFCIIIFYITNNWLNYLLQNYPLQIYYACPPSGDGFSNRQLTHNFELWVEIYCVPKFFVCHMRIPKPCLSVCPSVRTSRKEITLASSISILH